MPKVFPTAESAKSQCRPWDRCLLVVFPFFHKLRRKIPPAVVCQIRAVTLQYCDREVQVPRWYSGSCFFEKMEGLRCREPTIKVAGSHHIEERSQLRECGGQMLCNGWDSMNVARCDGEFSHLKKITEYNPQRANIKYKRIVVKFTRSSVVAPIKITPGSLVGKPKILLFHSWWEEEGLVKIE